MRLDRTWLHSHRRRITDRISVASRIEAPGVFGLTNTAAGTRNLFASLAALYAALADPDGTRRRDSIDTAIGDMDGRSMQAEDGVAPRAGAVGARPVASTGGSNSSDAAISNAKARDNGKRRAADETRFRMVEQIIAARLAGDPTLKGLKGQVRLVRTDDGLRIELVERADFAMFGSGTSDLGPEAQRLVQAVAEAIAPTPNQLTVRGHTDSLGFAHGGGSN